MDSAIAVSTADVTTTEQAHAAPPKQDGAAIRHAAAVANATQIVERAMSALATAQEHLQRAQDEQQAAQKRLMRLRQAVNEHSAIPARPTAT